MPQPTTHSLRALPRGLALIGALGVFAMGSFGRAEGLSVEERKVQEGVDRRAAEAIPLLEKAVNIRSATLNLAGVKEVGAAFGPSSTGSGSRRDGSRCRRRCIARGI